MAFSFRAGTNWCHDFPKLARESGFYFNMHGSRVRVDWNRIGAIDIDRVVRERDFSTIDQNINNVIDYCLESEYDVKILDPSFVKLFRLAQLSVEYLLYCKQYLDHSVIILKDELRQKIEQNVGMKKEIAALEDTVKSLKDRTRERRKLIETSVGEISNGEVFKCPHCPKTFVRAIFVSAHVARKHSFISDAGVTASPVHDHYRAETEKLHNEIKTLKERLNQTERVIRNESDKLLDNMGKDYARNMSKNEYDNGKADKFHEQRRYHEDIGSLKRMLFDEIRALREKDHVVNESILETNVKTLISQQEKEIENLRNQLLERLTPGMENMQVKLQTQENHWRIKMEDMEAQHRRDIEKLTTELKATQQVADRIKSEYVSKVHDLEKQSVDQSNMLVEQRKQLNNLSREISNSQLQINNYKTWEKNPAEIHKSPLLTINRDSNESKAYKSSNNTEITEMVVQDVDSESSQEYGDKLMSVVAQTENKPSKDSTVKSKSNKKAVTDSRTVERLNAKSMKKSDRSEVKKTRNNARYYDVLSDTDEIVRTNKNSVTKEHPIDVNKKYIGVREKKDALHTDNIKTNKRSEFLERRSVSSVTESGSLSSMSESETDSESVTTDDDLIKKYETPAVKSPNAKRISIQEDALSMFDNRLRELGIDPEWQGIPAATYKQKMEIVRHQQNINAKKLVRYSQIKQKILEDVLLRISANRKESRYSTLTKSSPLDKLVTHVKSKAWKAFSKNNGEYTSVQKTENTTPLKLRLKQKIELLPKKYRDDEVHENTRESPVKKSGADTYVSPNLARIPSISSASSIESREDIKQISPTKITVSDNNARKANSPINRKQVVAPKFSENNDSDSTIVQPDDSVLSPKNKSVLKPTSGSVGSLIKKKVLFDLDEKKNDTEGSQRKSQINSNDWSVSSFAERREYALQKEKSMSTGNIVLKTSQSDKIAEISKKIQEQLSIARKAPAGSVDTIFRLNTSSQDLTNYNAGNQLLNSILNSPQNLASPRTTGNMFPQAAPRTLKDKDLAVAQRKSEIKYSDLDSDIDEILQME
ncbi:PREDICTED: zinc finger protein DZIP1L [Vollenhovia emeryi]|uniref:zinc finger protein DZIP1L n=1 Tax=Vollenhovia emeryi TaxID=411798 RepID=UPI0005F44CA2|nr:PREDICTED: zinc finger protein DZIP1L [Vollenhovia emeryi]